MAYNRDSSSASNDMENRGRGDIKDVAIRIVEVLRRGDYQVQPVEVEGDVGGAVAAIRDWGAGLVFNLCECVLGDARFESLLPLCLELEGIPCTGSPPLSLAVASDKPTAKAILLGHGIPAPETIPVRTAHAGADTLPFPLIVKPSREDASVGISRSSVVWNDRALQSRIRRIESRYRQPALVERYIEGREIYCSILGGVDRVPRLLPPVEIDFTGLPTRFPKIVSFRGKWVHRSAEFLGTRPVLNRHMAPDTYSRLAATALAAFQALGLRDYGRVDVRLAEDGTPFVIDVNPNCDLSDVEGGFAWAARSAGIDYESLILRLVGLAEARLAKRSRKPILDSFALSSGGAAR